MSELSDYLKINNVQTQEGGLDGYEEQSKILRNLMLQFKGNIKVLEIGFNAGFSAEFFLSFEKASVVSFDLNVWPTVLVAKKWIDRKYPGRHTLFIGDSEHSVRDFFNSNPSEKFDLIFVDGGHHYEIVRADMENVEKLSHKNTIVVLDDVCRLPENKRHYTEGPTKVWQELLNENRVFEISQHEKEGRGCVWGRFLLK